LVIYPRKKKRKLGVYAKLIGWTSDMYASSLTNVFLTCTSLHILHVVNLAC